MMKRGQLALLLFLLLGIALWLTYGLWLLPLLAQLPGPQRPTYLFPALEAAVNLAFFAINGALALLLWRSRRKRRQEPAWEAGPLRPVTPEQIRQNLGLGGQVNWIDRSAARVSDLRTHHRLLIVGRTGLGKTREAAELIRRALSQGLVPEERIYEPTPWFHLLTSDSLRSALGQRLTPQLPLLLFLDDLPCHVLGEGLDQLQSALSTLQKC